jgi:arylsulfate sulfotransferase
MKRICWLFFILLLLSCNDTTRELSDGCEQYAEVSDILDLILENEDYISSFEDNEDAFIIKFNSSDSLIIDPECVTSYEIVEPNTLLLDFGQERILSFPYLDFNIFNFKYNPKGWTPLSGSLNLGINNVGNLKITVLGKESNDIDYNKTFLHDNMNTLYPVLGLYYNHLNHIITEWTDGDITIIDTFTIMTPSQPDFVKDFNVIKADLEKMEPGMTLISNRIKDNPSVPYMIDHTGKVRYVLDFEGHPDLQNLNYDVGMERLRNGNYYFGHYPTSKLYEIDIYGEVINKWQITGYAFHHNIQEKDNGNLLVTVNKYGSTHLNGNNTVEDHIIELDRNTGGIVNEWDLRESLDEYRFVQSVNPNAEFVDWAHANAVIESPTDNSIIVSCRKQGLIKLSQDNEVQWILNNHFRWGQNRRGEDLNQFLLTPLDRSGNPIIDPEVLNGSKNHEDFEWNWFQHAPFLLDGNRVFCFDNGDRRNYYGTDVYSRAVEYIIDEETMTVQQVWAYGKERGVETFSRVVSDVDYLPEKNNILFAPGAGTLNGPGQFGGRIVEIDYDTKQVVSEMSINGGGFIWHRVERLPLYPN